MGNITSYSRATYTHAEPTPRTLARGFGGGASPQTPSGFLACFPLSTGQFNIEVATFEPNKAIKLSVFLYPESRIIYTEKRTVFFCTPDQLQPHPPQEGRIYLVYPPTVNNPQDYATNSLTLFSVYVIIIYTENKGWMLCQQSLPGRSKQAL